MRVNRASWTILAAAIACSGPSADEDDGREPDYIGPCNAWQENAILLPGAGCFRVEVPNGTLGRHGMHPCEPTQACAVIEYSGSGDSGWSWFHDLDEGVGGSMPGPNEPVVTAQACGTRC